MKFPLILVILVAVSISGCADVNIHVHTSGPPEALHDGKTYALVRTPSQEVSPQHAQHEALVSHEMAKFSYAEAPLNIAHYRVSIAYETRPTVVNVSGKVSAGAVVNEQCSRPNSLLHVFRDVYRHALTLRFFDRKSGREPYKVTATRCDHDADPTRAMPYLVSTALARIPFRDYQDWQVIWHLEDRREGSRIVTIRPVEQ
ncbi:DUF4136 domain-containing protein [Cupriavidus necator]